MLLKLDGIFASSGHEDGVKSGTKTWSTVLGQRAFSAGSRSATN